jgi:hypothetical protein
MFGGSWTGKMHFAVLDKYREVLSICECNQTCTKASKYKTGLCVIKIFTIIRSMCPSESPNSVSKRPYSTPFHYGDRPCSEFSVSV